MSDVEPRAVNANKSLGYPVTTTNWSSISHGAITNLCWRSSTLSMCPEKDGIRVKWLLVYITSQVKSR